MKGRIKGQVLVLFALLLFVLCGLAALGIDVGYLYSVRHELQRSADAGALAGASAFLEGGWNEGPIRATADARARDYASRDPVATVPLDPGGEVAVAFPVEPRITVTTSRTVPLFFARVLGMQTRLVTASATAEAVAVDRNLPCIKPWGIPFPWDDTNGDALYTPGETVHTDCPEGTTASNYFCQGTRIVLKVGTPAGKPEQPDLPSLQQEPGHFFALDFGSGGSTYRDAIKADCPEGSPLSVGDSVPLEPGNIVGPTYQGVQSDGDSLVSQDPNSVWNAEQGLPESDRYHVSDGSWMDSPRVVRVPVYDPRVPLETGKTDMVIAAFAGFWVEAAYKDGQQGTVVGRFIPSSAFGESSGAAPGPGAGPILRQIRLVE